MIDTRIVSDDGQGCRREHGPRVPIAFATHLREYGTEAVDARLINISAHGFMADIDGDFAPGTRVWLMLPGRKRANALVKWASGRRIGAEFAEEIDPLSVLAAAGRRAA